MSKPTSTQTDWVKVTITDQYGNEIIIRLNEEEGDIVNIKSEFDKNQQDGSPAEFAAGAMLRGLRG